jgi:hypothetical protein
MMIYLAIAWMLAGERRRQLEASGARRGQGRQAPIERAAELGIAVPVPLSVPGTDDIGAGAREERVA